MRFLTDGDVARLVTPAGARDAVRAAFAAFADGGAAVQQRERTTAGEVKLSTLGAVLPADGVLGAKVYSTVHGRFTFLVVLFAADDGRRLAVLESDVLTRLRTAATSVVATDALRDNGPPRRLTVIGTGTQATGHVEAFADRFELDEVVLVGRSSRPDLAAELAATTGVEVRCAVLANTIPAVEGADVVVTATRSSTPVLAGDWVSPGALVCAVGSSRPDACELDGAVYGRASVVAVEWLRQSRAEAGGLIDAVTAGVLSWADVTDLADLVAGRAGPVRTGGDIMVFQSVGIGLADVAVAAVAWRAAEAQGAGSTTG